MSSKKKTLLVGLDAACWDYLNPLLQAGQLPTIQRLIEQGASGVLMSTMPAWTPTAWSSIITGKNPGKHGVFDMVVRLPGTYEQIPSSAQVRRGSSFWQKLNEHDVRVGLVNIPFAYPIRPLEGFIVCGFGTPNSATDIAYPDDVLTSIQDNASEYKPVVDPQILRSGDTERIFSAEREHQATQVQFAAEFAASHDVDVLVINLMLLDHANHKMPEMTQVNQAIIETDRDLQTLLETFEPDYVMAISDHGASRVKGNFLLQAWLRDQGYLTQAARQGEDRTKALNFVLRQWLRKHYGLPHPIERLARRAALWLAPRLPDGLARQFWRQVDQAVPFAEEMAHFSDAPDYERTKLFPGSVHSGLLYLNVAGREPNGTVAPDERKALLAELAKKLRGIVDPDTGEPLLSNVFTGDEIFSGAAAAAAPDLVLDGYGSTWNIQLKGFTAVAQQSRHRYFIGGADYGWHSRDGIFVFSGPVFNEGRATEVAHLIDLPATLLYLYDVPVPEDYDGRVLTDLMKPEFVVGNPIRYQAGDKEDVVRLNGENPYSSQEMDELFDHLKALGYIE